MIIDYYWLLLMIYLWILWLLLMFIDDYWWLLIVIYVVLCWCSMYNCRDQRTFFRGVFKKLIWLVWKLWISSISSARNLQILDFSRKNKKIKNLKNALGKVRWSRHLYIPLTLGESKSLLVISEISRLIPNTLHLPMTSIIFVTGRLYCNQFKCNYLTNQKSFLNFCCISEI